MLRGSFLQGSLSLEPDGLTSALGKGYKNKTKHFTSFSLIVVYLTKFLVQTGWVLILQKLLWETMWLQASVYNMLSNTQELHSRGASSI